MLTALAHSRHVLKIIYKGSSTEGHFIALARFIQTLNSFVLKIILFVRYIFERSVSEDTFLAVF